MGSVAFATESNVPVPLITPDSIAMPGSTFFAAFTSPDDVPRNAAWLYFLGVMDVTEGKRWCDYKTMKTITVRANVFEYFKKLPPQRMSERASVLIEEALSRSFPCGKGRP